MKLKLIAAALAACFFAAAPASASVRDLEGAWDAQNVRNDGLAELDISYDGTNWSVAARAMCGSRTCDLGKVVGYTMVPLGKTNVRNDASGVSAGFTGSDATRQLIILVAANRLEVTFIQSWRDGRPATVSREIMVRAGRTPGDGGGGTVEAQCRDTSNLKISWNSGRWVLTQSGQVVASFDTPDQAGYARWIAQSYELRRKCAIQDGGFEYWINSNGKFPKGNVDGEYCSQLGDVRARAVGNSWRVEASGQTLYQVKSQGVAETIVRTLKDNNARSVCYVGRQGNGMTYFKR